MSEEKQIEEMAEVIAKADDTCRAKTIADSLYDAGYRKQSENVIEFPCKVGEIVYAHNSIVPYWHRMHKEYTECEVLAIIKTKKQNLVKIASRRGQERGERRYMRVPFSSFGKTVFITEKEAEAKMKGGAE